jgi:hypothetical protein
MHFLLAPRGGRYGVVGKRSLTREHDFPKLYFLSARAICYRTCYRSLTLRSSKVALALHELAPDGLAMLRPNAVASPENSSG